MFRALAKVPIPPSSTSTSTPPGQYGADNVFRLHPTDIVALLEAVWDTRRKQAVDLGRPFRRNALSRFSDTWFGNNLFSHPLPEPSPQPPIDPLVTAIASSDGTLSDHLIYAYMIENTRIKEVFRRVVHEFLHGEKVGVPSADTQQWLRTTEQLFYRDPPPLFVTSVHSDLRPDGDATRRNAYQRMFGMDLNHGGSDGKPYPYVRAEAANKEFVSTFEELLREVWIGIINAGNSSGTKSTDDAKLADLIKKLQDMLIARRINGNLSREEFTFVSMMAWFHLTVESDTAVVVDLRAQAASAEQRLFKIAQLVGIPAQGLAASYFDIADSISRILILIESGFFTTVPAAIVGLYTPGNALERAMRTIITHYSIISGRDMKAGKLVPMEAARRPALQQAGNGRPNLQHTPADRP
jgi:hypothetical protein